MSEYRYAWKESNGKLFEYVDRKKVCIHIDESLSDALEYMNCAHGEYIDENSVEIL